MQAFYRKHKGLASSLVSDVEITNPVLSRYIHKEPTEIFNYTAIWDTGAQASVITSRVANDLHLVAIGVSTNFGVHGPKQTNKYVVDFILPNHVYVRDVQVTEGLLRGFDVLIGMDIISIGDFAVSNFENNTSFTFRFPSQKDTNYVEEVKEPAHSTKIGRNSPCPCGSGKKYKICDCKEYH
ncbi:MAG: SEC-C domain-containing protein [Tenericutes bacterium]|nr:SEC-C domain-containing protein [Mycoplasmatota bacterium]